MTKAVSIRWRPKPSSNVNRSTGAPARTAFPAGTDWRLHPPHDCAALSTAIYRDHNK